MVKGTRSAQAQPRDATRRVAHSRQDRVLEHRIKRFRRHLSLLHINRIRQAAQEIVGTLAGGSGSLGDYVGGRGRHKRVFCAGGGSSSAVSGIQTPLTGSPAMRLKGLEGT